MYACYVAMWLSTCGKKKDSLKKNSQRESNTETEKGRAIFFEGNTLSHPLP